MESLIKYKKIIIIAGFIGIVFILGYLLYAMFLKTEEKTITADRTVSTSTGQLPQADSGQNLPSEEQKKGYLEPQEDDTIKSPSIDEAAKGGLTKVSNLVSKPSLGATVGKNGNNIQYYDKTDGRFYKLDENDNPVLMTDKIFHRVESVAWSSNKNKAILEYPDGSNILYDFDTNKQVSLPSHWEDFEFSPKEDKIIMKSIGLDENNRWLAISNDDGSKAKKIEDIGGVEDQAIPSWSPNNQSVAMFVEGVDFDRQELFFIGQNKENFKSTIIEGRGFESTWSPQGNQLLYSVYSTRTNLKPSLWIVGAQGEGIGSGRKSMNVETWASKCTYVGDYDVFCAVPKSLEDGSGLIPELAENTSDTLMQIDTRTGQKKTIAIPDGDYNISQIMVNSDKSKLYFTANNNIYKINL